MSTKDSKTDISAPTEDNAKIINSPSTPTTSFGSSKGKAKRQAPFRAKTEAVMGILRSANLAPTQITYKGEIAFVPPNGIIPNVDKSGLKFPLPDGIKFIEDRK